jgi:LysM repeat protein
MLKGIIGFMNKQLQNAYLVGIFLLISITLSACAGETTIQLPESVNTPIFATATPKIAPTQTLTATLTPTPIQTATQLPSPTSTPRSHSVKLGETLGGIALIYNVSLDGILSINPEVNPNAMTVGMTILIPAGTQIPGNQTSFPTPIAMPISDLNCLADSAKGVWCFGLIENITDEILESVVVNVNLADQQATALFSQKALLPLNVLFPDEKLPFAAYFSPEMPDPFQFSAQFTSSIPLDVAVNQYQRVEILDQQFTINDPSTTRVSGSFELPENTTQIWVVAIALNESGNIIGLRKWESTEPETGVFEFNLYAVSGQIAEVLVYAEAQP